MSPFGPAGSLCLTPPPSDMDRISAIGIFLIPAIFYLVEKLSGAKSLAVNLTPAPAQGD